ncbi:MAG: D-alanine--D-alanine ligase [Gammaproteobacteria bacterium]|nr:D-alanine--D-alanine ligase [Gammaproteobacteria bacterium]
MTSGATGRNSLPGPCAVILHDAIPASAPADEQDSLQQAAVVEISLHALGHTTQTVPFDENLTALRQRLVALDPRLVFNLVESRAGHGHLIHLAPALLEDLGLPFTGTPQLGVFLTSHKLLAKRWLIRHGCPAPAAVDDPARPENGPWIVKSVWEDASFGLDDASVVTNSSALAAQLYRRRAELGGEWFAESYVPGREFNVSLLECDKGCRVLPIAEIRFEDYAPGVPQIVGYRAKWAGDSFEYAHTARQFGSCNAALCEDMSKLASRCWEIFELRGYARVDFRIDDAGRPWILEVNVNPCLAPDAGFAAALAQAGIVFDDAIAAIAAAATREKGTFVMSRDSRKWGHS